ncbi:eukaryotic translation elongation factor 1 epsilon-1 isoform X1 [Rhagoletis pomonella]|uniref:eukaryotic translation elongation factor 1 epsilon-1 isoform X1 n=1 Tax=Rhagoletis pomonella TaxID=28610 RepID=UPI001785E5C0|nr:eukaryotic translation elongation factor 1 epsilon-1 isoform X1 [Rhagoletis pomonella]
MYEVETITKIANSLGVPAGDVKLNSEKVVTRTKNSKTVSGFATILNNLAQESKSEIALNSAATREISAEVYQWIEFAVLYVAPGSKDKHISQQLLRDFNKLFTTKSYLVGYFITISDLAIFFAIYDLVKSLTPLEKENYLNLSRWFDHLQQRPEISQGDSLLNFNTIYLHGWATGTHV